MRLCPKCGYIDQECWRPAAFHPEISYADIEALSIIEPELVKELLLKRKTIRLPYVYWMSSKSETIRREWIKDYERTGKSGSNQEHISHQDERIPKTHPAYEDSINLYYVNHPKIRKGG